MTKAQEVVKTVHFDTNKTELSAMEQTSLDSMAKSILEKGQKVVIVGFADTRGTKLYNLSLGQKRAETVAAYLLSKGVKDIVVSVSYGKEKSVKLKEHYAFDRRTDIILIQPKEVEKEVTVTQVVKTEPKKNRVTLYGGAGPINLSTTKLGKNLFEIQQDYTAVVGVSYSRLIGNGVSVGIIGFSNATWAISFGVDF